MNHTTNHQPQDEMIGIGAYARGHETAQWHLYSIALGVGHLTTKEGRLHLGIRWHNDAGRFGQWPSGCCFVPGPMFDGDCFENGVIRRGANEGALFILEGGEEGAGIKTTQDPYWRKQLVRLGIADTTIESCGYAIHLPERERHVLNYTFTDEDGKHDIYGPDSHRSALTLLTRTGFVEALRRRDRSGVEESVAELNRIHPESAILSRRFPDLFELHAAREKDRG